MLGLWTHVELEVTDRVAAVREKCDLLIELHPLRREHLKQSPFRFGIKRLHEAKALAGGDIFFLIASEGQRTLANDDLKVMLLGLPIPHVAPINADRDRPIRDGQVPPIARAALD